MTNSPTYLSYLLAGYNYTKYLLPDNPGIQQDHFHFGKYNKKHKKLI